VQPARYYWLLLAEGHMIRPAIWGDAGTDRTSARTGGLDNRAQVSNGVLLRRVRLKRGVAKSDEIWAMCEKRFTLLRTAGFVYALCRF
jgi:hypothetical protein